MHDFYVASNYVKGCETGASFINDFSIVIRIRWKWFSALIQVVFKLSLRHLAHGKADVAHYGDVCKLFLAELHINVRVTIRYIQTPWVGLTVTNTPPGIGYHMNRKYCLEMPYFYNEFWFSGIFVWQSMENAMMQIYSVTSFVWNNMTRKWMNICFKLILWWCSKTFFRNLFSVIFKNQIVFQKLWFDIVKMLF